MSGTRTGQRGNAITWATSRIKAIQNRLRKQENNTLNRRTLTTVFSTDGTSIVSNTTHQGNMTINNDTQMMKMNLDGIWMVDENAPIGNLVSIAVTSVPNNGTTGDGSEINMTDDGNMTMQPAEENGGINGQTVVAQTTLNRIVISGLINYFSSIDPTGVLADTFLIMIIILTLLTPVFNSDDSNTINLTMDSRITDIVNSDLNVSRQAYENLLDLNVSEFFNQTDSNVTVREVLSANFALSQGTSSDILSFFNASLNNEDFVVFASNGSSDDSFNLYFQNYYNGIFNQNEFRTFTEILLGNTFLFLSDDDICVDLPFPFFTTCLNSPIPIGLFVNTFGQDRLDFILNNVEIQNRYNSLSRVMITLMRTADNTNTFEFTNLAPNAIGAANGTFTLPNTSFS